MVKNIKLLVWIGVVFIVVGFIGKSFYRDYIYLNEINDFGIAGFLPSYLNVVGLSLMLFVGLFIKPSPYPQLFFVFVPLGSILYELMQYKLSGTLDVPDILASIAGGITGYLIFWMVQRYGKNELRPKS